MNVSVMTSGGEKHVFSPEKIMYLCGKYASSTDGKIAVGHDGSAAGAAAASAAAAGIALCGRACIDFGAIPIAVMRFAAGAYALSGGVHISQHTAENCLRLDFVDGHGICSGNAAICGSFECAGSAGISEIISIKSYKYYYMRTLINSCHSPRLGGKILLNIKNPELQYIVTSMLADLGCEYSLFAETLDLNGSCKKFKTKLMHEGFTLGAHISDDGQTLVLFDKFGHMATNDVMEALRALIVFKARPSATYVARITSPDIIDRLAEKYGGTVIRAGSSDCEIMRTLTHIGSAPKTQLMLEFDAAYALIAVLDFLKSYEIEPELLLSENDGAPVENSDLWCFAAQA